MFHSLLSYNSRSHSANDNSSDNDEYFYKGPNLDKTPKTYWKGTGSHQEEFDQLMEKLSPNPEKITPYPLEFVRVVADIYHDLFTNAWESSLRATNHRDQGAWNSEIKTMLKKCDAFHIPASVTTWLRRFQNVSNWREEEAYLHEEDIQHLADEMDEILDTVVHHVAHLILAK